MSLVPGAALRRLLLYVEPSSPNVLYRLSPITKVTIMLCLSIMSFLTMNTWFLLVLAMTSAILLILARVPKSSVRLLFVGVLWLMVVQILIAIFVARYEGVVLFEFSLIRITDTNLVVAMSLAFRLITMVFSSIFVLITTKPEDLIRSFSLIGIPYTVSFTFGLTLRCLAIFAVDYTVIGEAQMSRGLEVSKGNFIQRARKYVNMLKPVGVITMRRIDSLSNAIESRAFGSGKRSRYYKPRFGLADYSIIIVSIIALVSAIMLRFYLGILN